MTRAYYSENDPFAAEWLKILIVAGLIAEGDVDTRSIEDVTPSDIAGYTQVHLFAGIGGWSYSMRLAGWPDSRPAWSCSCPCQPFSAAGKGGGFADERHLWPAAHWLIAQCRPVTIFGEQVASKDGLAWLDTVQTDLEATAYSIGAVDICAAGVGAPHIRQRLYWRADSQSQNGRLSIQQRGSFQNSFELTRGSAVGVGTDANYSERWPELQEQRESYRRDGFSQRDDSIVTRLEGYARNGGIQWGSEQARSIAEAGATRGHWAAADWWYGRDGKFRPIEPGVQPLAHGVPARMGRLRGYGNAIVAPLAAEFIQATEEVF